MMKYEQALRMDQILGEIAKSGAMEEFDIITHIFHRDNYSLWGGYIITAGERRYIERVKAFRCLEHAQFRSLYYKNGKNMTIMKQPPARLKALNKAYKLVSESRGFRYVIFKGWK